MDPHPLADNIAAVRRFNRFYTGRIGALDEAHLGAPYGLAEVRVLYEVAQAPDGVTPKSIAAETGLDPGYLSRILKRFEREALMVRARSPQDGRSITLRLTPAGLAAYGELRRVAEGAVEGMIAPLSPGEQARLTAAMGEVEALLTRRPAGAVTLRPHRVGDMGWVIRRHALLYAREYGWDERFEALAARICADFIEGFDPARERCWIAERDGRPLGSIFLVKGEGDEARLRLLLIEPEARGLGLGKRLVAECLAFARAAGYGGVTLWTQSILTAARGGYAAARLELTDSAPHRSLGVDLVGETWRLRFQSGMVCLDA
jgi:DNA-binding MarR family transcriptional regulator/GNAT superfamily N-acetyltransferase